MSSFPSPTAVQTQADVRAFFDGLAAEYAERHGPAEDLLTRRLAVLDRYAQFSPTDVVLDLGSGPGRHLAALADRIGRGVGVDLSPDMVAVARRHAAHPALSFRVDDAERLDTVPRSSVDTVLCVGVLEHLLRPARALLRTAGLVPTVAFWRFVPEGDLPRPLSRVCRGLDLLGRRVAAPTLRGGLCLVGRAT